MPLGPVRPRGPRLHLRPRRPLRLRSVTPERRQGAAPRAGEASRVDLMARTLLVRARVAGTGVERSGVRAGRTTVRGRAAVRAGRAAVGDREGVERGAGLAEPGDARELEGPLPH